MQTDWRLVVFTAFFSHWIQDNAKNWLDLGFLKIEIPISVRKKKRFVIDAGIFDAP